MAVLILILCAAVAVCAAVKLALRRRLEAIDGLGRVTRRGDTRESDIADLGGDKK